MQIQSARVLITGGGSGIGRATAQRLAERGARLLVCGRRPEPLAEVAAATGAETMTCDVSDEQQVLALGRRIDDAFGGVDALINNAAIGYRTSLLELDAQRFDELFAINVRGAALVARECAKRMVRQGSGTIVNVASTAASRGYPGGSAYAASKFALSGLTQCWRSELRSSGVRVMQVNPSEVVTPFGGRADLTEDPTRLRAQDVAQLIESCLTLDDRGFVTETTLWATNPS